MSIIEKREHYVLTDAEGNPEECIDDCPGCFPELWEETEDILSDLTTVAAIAEAEAE